MTEGLSWDLPLWLVALLGGLLGLVIGSFLATLLIRWPKGEPALAGRSRCDACGAAIDPRHLAV